ncbi:MAG: tRNA pseudouridine(38-40) synthase TruA [Bacteroidota bacterium]
MSKEKRMRYVLDISYKGSNYAGWQRQENAFTVQEELEQALSTVLASKISVLGAGRTDAGVHAKQLIVHFDYDQALTPTLQHSLNGILSRDISVNHIYQAKSPEFHARFDAISRAYTYQCIQKKSPFHQESALWLRHPVDLELLEKASNIITQYTDFASFCKARSDNKTNICRIDHAHWEEKDELLLFHIQADRFLRGMVRTIVGTLLEIARGKRKLESLHEILKGKDRRLAGPSAEACGLYLTEVNYPPGSFESM